MPMFGPIISRIARPVVTGAFLMLVAPASAQPLPAEPPPAPTLPADPQHRYSFRPVEDGIMRLDATTGAVSICTRDRGDYLCRAVPDDRRAMDDEIARLTQENADLRGRAGPGRLGQLRDGAKTLLPSEQEVDQALGLLERTIRRVIRTLREENAADDRL